MTKSRLIIIGCLCIFLLSCESQNSTPDKFKYHSNVNELQYLQNQREIKDSVEIRIKNKLDPFYQKENDSLTEIFVDTILYSPNKDKYASFVITKNSNDKLLDKGSHREYHYNAYCFIGEVNDRFNVGDFTWIGAHSLVLFKSLEAASFRIREVYFKEITLRTNSNNESTFKYNFDDVRFWNGPVWKKYYK